jgi:hypothetical protein
MAITLDRIRSWVAPARAATRSTNERACGSRSPATYTHTTTVPGESPGPPCNDSRPLSQFLPISRRQSALLHNLINHGLVTFKSKGVFLLPRPDVNVSAILLIELNTEPGVIFVLYSAATSYNDLLAPYGGGKDSRRSAGTRSRRFRRARVHLSVRSRVNADGEPVADSKPSLPRSTTSPVTRGTSIHVRRAGIRRPRGSECALRDSEAS